MARLWAKSTNFQGLAFFTKTNKLLLWHLKWEEKTVNCCLGDLRMEDQGVQSLQTFLVKNFPVFQLPLKHRCTFK